MALTNAQLVDVRRYMGYPAFGTNMPVDAQHDNVYSQFGMTVITLYRRLTTLSAEEESVLINTYLTNLTSLEAAIVGTSANLDTDQAAVWVHNKRERQDREALFNSWCRRLCGFLGFEPGAALGGGSVQIVRG